MKFPREDEPKAKREFGPKLTRRSFIKLTSLVGGALGWIGGIENLARAASLPIQKVLRINHEEKWIASSCLNCASRCGIRVRVVDGNAVKITGNPYSQVSEGKICPRGHISLQVLYDPDRIRTPLKRTSTEKGRGVDPRWVPISWEEAFDEISARLNRLRNNREPHRLLLFCGLNSVAAEDLILRFAEVYGTPNVFTQEGLEGGAERAGNWMADGHFDSTAYDLDRTNYILAFGADFLESSRPLSRNLRKWGKIRREKPIRTKVVAINPRYSLTAAKADEWIPIKPGTDGALAMGIAHVIISEGLYSTSFVKEWASGFEEYKNLALRYYSPDAVSRITGIEPEVIRRISREFAECQPAVAIKGRASIDWPNGSLISYAIHCLNALVGSIDIPGGVLYQEYPSYTPMPGIVADDVAQKGRLYPAIDLRGTEKFPVARMITNQVPDSVLEGNPYPVEMAIGFNCNFNMSAPNPDRWERALKKLPYYVHISPFISEMGLYANIVLPCTTFLEEWGYEHSPPGSGFAEARIKQPVVSPLGESKPVIDIIFGIARRLGGRVSQAFEGIGDNAEGFVRFRTERLAPWKEFAKKGVWIGKKYEYRKYNRLFLTPTKRFEFSPGNLRASTSRTQKTWGVKYDPTSLLRETKFVGDVSKYPFILLPYHPLMAFDNGSQNYPWAQEIFLPMQGVGWETTVEINADVAKEQGLKDGQTVWVESPFGRIKARLKLSEGIYPSVVAIPVGQGHYSYGRWQRGIGVNPYEIIGVEYDAISGQAVSFNTRVKVYKA